MLATQRPVAIAWAEGMNETMKDKIVIVGVSIIAATTIWIGCSGLALANGKGEPIAWCEKHGKQPSKIMPMPKTEEQARVYMAYALGYEKCIQQVMATAKAMYEEYLSEVTIFKVIQNIYANDSTKKGI